MDIQQTPALNGLVLAGGKSIRMGTDKALLDWHGIEQRYYMAGLLQRLCNTVFISCRSDQQSGIDPHYPVLADSKPGLGPMSGILTAFGHDPQCAWLVTACDLPLLDMDTLQYLIRHRHPQSIATTFRSPHDGLPEPLITIWEPASFPVLQQFAAQGITCPRKVLLNSPVAILEPPHAASLLNANTPADAEKVRQLLQEKLTVPDAS
ncbi:MAG: NTP transferase domain-containing protein [Williamsia sp.]|nr:NTP transferase domain-containing protein [Williamsia sp.]